MDKKCFLKENSLHEEYNYQMVDKVLINDKDTHRELSSPNKWPHSIMQVYVNGTVQEQKNAVY